MIGSLFDFAKPEMC